MKEHVHLEPIIETNRFLIRCIREEDVTDRFLSWLQGFNPYRSGTGPVPDREGLCAYVRDTNARDDALFLTIILKETGLHIGNIKFEAIDLQGKKAKMDIFIGDPAWEGKGANCEVIQHCAEWLDHHLGVDSILTEVKRADIPAYRDNLRRGFRKFQDDKDKDSFLMLRKERPILRLAIDTAQFNFNIKSSEEMGSPGREEARRILRHAWSEGISLMDTATTNADGESVLGDMGIQEWRVITKLPFIDPEDGDVLEKMEGYIRQSLQRLGVNEIYGVLPYRLQDLLEPNGGRILEALRHCKGMGLLRKIGISIDGPEELEAVWPLFIPDLVQAPFNIIDRRVSESGWLKRMKKENVEVHARSVFPQELISKDSLEMSVESDHSKGECGRWFAENHSDSMQACLVFALSNKDIDRVMLEVEGLAQLEMMVSFTDKLQIPVSDHVLQG